MVKAKKPAKKTKAQIYASRVKNLKKARAAKKAKATKRKPAKRKAKKK